MNEDIENSLNITSEIESEIEFSQTLPLQPSQPQLPQLC